MDIHTTRLLWGVLFIIFVISRRAADSQLRMVEGSSVNFWKSSVRTACVYIYCVCMYIPVILPLAAHWVPQLAVPDAGAALAITVTLWCSQLQYSAPSWCEKKISRSLKPCSPVRIWSLHEIPDLALRPLTRTIQFCIDEPPPPSPIHTHTSWS